MGNFILKSILKNYEQKLCDKMFKYELNNKWLINLVFLKENFCHLIGLHHVYNKNKKYLGMSGYKLIIDEKVTIEAMKNHNEKGYNYIKDKIQFFDMIYELLVNGNAIRFYIDRVKPYTEIVADFLIYYKNKEMLLHLFMRKEDEKTNKFTPVSFIVKSANDKYSNQFIAGQEYKNITKFEILEANGKKDI